MKPSSNTLTPIGQFNFVHVFNKTLNYGKTKEIYSLTFVIDKNEENDRWVNSINEEAKSILRKALAKDKPIESVKITPSMIMPINDGDNTNVEEFHGKWVINMKNHTNKPTVIDLNKQVLSTEEDFYSGCMGRVSFSFYSYTEQAKGVSCSMNSILKTADGKRLGGKNEGASNPFDAFGLETELV